MADSDDPTDRPDEPLLMAAKSVAFQSMRSDPRVWHAALDTAVEKVILDLVQPWFAGQVAAAKAAQDASIAELRRWVNYNSTDMGELGRYIRVEYVHNGIDQFAARAAVLAPTGMGQPQPDDRTGAATTLVGRLRPGEPIALYDPAYRGLAPTGDQSEETK